MRHLILYFMLLLALPVCAQHHVLKSLSVGDTLPPLFFQKVLNTPDGTLDIRDLQGRSLIIDFGGTYCPPCLESLLKMDSLQPKYANKILMVMANNQQKKDWDILYKRNAAFEQVKIPIITEDTILYQLFKHSSEPHLIWVGGDRKVKAITEHRYVSDWAMEQFLKGGVLDWPLKSDIRLDDSTRLITWNNTELTKENQPKEMEMGFVSGYVSGLQPFQRVVVDSNRKEMRYVGVNAQLLNIYNAALHKLKKTRFNENQIFLGVGVDDRLFFNPAGDSIPLSKWRELYSVSYEVTVPIHYSLEKSITKVWNDVSAYLGLVVIWEPKRIPVLVIKDVTDVSGKAVVSERISELIGRTKMSWNGIHIIDESNYTGRQKFLMRIPKIKLTTDILQVKTALQQAGVECQIEERSVNILAVSKKEF